MSATEIEDGVFETTAVIDNGSFGTRTIRFETGRLAQQAAGAVVAYLDDETMLLSATTASKTPKDHFDFFPLTIDVEERMYAAGRIPGSFFRREGRPSTDAILTCRLIDRPLRPTFVSGLRNEIQVVVTILSLDPKDLYDVLAINAASASTQISGLPFSGPVGGVRVAPDRRASGSRSRPSSSSRAPCSTWSSRAARPDRRRRDHDGRGRGHRQRHRADRRRRAGADREPSWPRASRPPSRSSPRCATRSRSWPRRAAKPTADYPVFPDYQDDVFYAVSSVATDELSKALTIAGKEERDDRTDEIKVEVLERLGRDLRGP